MTQEEREKIVWQNINSSKERGKILKGKIIAIETEKMKDKNIECAILDFRGIKILIPAVEIAEELENNKKIIRNMLGAEIDFIVVETDRTAEKAIASRKLAMKTIKDRNIKRLEKGDIIYGSVVGVWKKFIRIEVAGIDFIVKAQDLQYGYIEDVSKLYHLNDSIKVLVKEVDKEEQTFRISIKELLEDPFKNIRKDFTEKGEYLARITGYTDSGIFANIVQGVDTICTLPTWLDKPPMPGDEVIIKIYKIVPERRKIYSSLIKVIGSGANE